MAEKIAMISFRVSEGMKEEAAEIARRLGFRSISDLFRALYERPDIYAPLVLSEREKLKKTDDSGEG